LKCHKKKSLGTRHVIICKKWTKSNNKKFRETQILGKFLWFKNGHREFISVDRFNA